MLSNNSKRGIFDFTDDYKIIDSDDLYYISINLKPYSETKIEVSLSEIQLSTVRIVSSRERHTKVTLGFLKNITRIFFCDDYVKGDILLSSPKLEYIKTQVLPHRFPPNLKSLDFDPYSYGCGGVDLDLKDLPPSLNKFKLSLGEGVFTIVGQFGKNLKEIEIGGVVKVDSNVFDMIEQLDKLELWSDNNNLIFPPTRTLILINVKDEITIRNPEVTTSFYCCHKETCKVSQKMLNLNKLTINGLDIPDYRLHIKKLIITKTLNFFSSGRVVSTFPNISNFPNLKVIKCDDVNYEYLLPLQPTYFPNIKLKRESNTMVNIKTYSDYWI